MTKTIITVHSDINSLLDLLKINPSDKTVSVKCDPRDPDETQGDIPRKVVRKNPYKSGLCEIAGLVRRARVELADGSTGFAALTLGRVANAIDRELNK